MRRVLFFVILLFSNNLLGKATALTEFGVGSQLSSHSNGWQGTMLAFRSSWSFSKLSIGLMSIATKSSKENLTNNFLGSGPVLSYSLSPSWTIGCTIGKGHSMSANLETREESSESTKYLIALWEKTLYETPKFGLQLGGKVMRGFAQKSYHTHSQAFRVVSLALNWRL